ncbi:MAG: DUF2066 domain-containing protein [Steroidobacteraceae bacterium]
MMNRRRSWIAAVAIAALAQHADAASLGDMYTLTVPVTGQGESAQQAAFRDAMQDVLVRATGRRDAADLESLAPLVAQAGRHVVSFRRAAGSQLAVTFNGTTIENAIDAAGLPFWGPDRPLTLVWLAVERGGRRSLAGPAAGGDDKQRVEEAAARRGVPLVWPGAGDDLARGLQQAWSGDHEPLASAARRYGADGVLIGRAMVTAGGQYIVDWTFSSAGLSAETRGGLEAGPDLAADRYASAYASRNAGQRIEQLVTVTGIDTLDAYATALRALGRLPLVRGVAVDEVTPDAVSFALRIRGDPDALRQAIRREARLVPVDESRMIFALAP